MYRPWRIYKSTHHALPLGAIYGIWYTTYRDLYLHRLTVYIRYVVTADAGRERRHRYDTPADGRQETAIVFLVDAVPLQEHDVSGTGQERCSTDQRAQAPTRRH